MSVWKSINTAPKDGTLVDLWGINHLRFDKEQHRITNVSFGDVVDWMGRERKDWRHGRGEDFEPTHWMQRPKSPQEQDNIWKPISTAKDNGLTEFLVGVWVGDRWSQWVVDLHPDYPDEYGNDGEFGDTPTHWTTLPEPPERM